MQYSQQSDVSDVTLRAENLFASKRFYNLRHRVKTCLEIIVGETIPFVQFLKRQMLDFFGTAELPYLTWKEELVIPKETR